MVKAQARPGLAPERDQNGELVFDNGELQYADTTPDLRWVGNGRVVLDNKGNVVKAYEPYYSSTADYEDEAELVAQGLTPLNHYDPLGRLIRTDLPHGTFSKVEFTPWQQITHDENDTVLDSDWYDERINYGGRRRDRPPSAPAHAASARPTRTRTPLGSSSAPTSLEPAASSWSKPKPAPASPRACPSSSRRARSASARVKSAHRRRARSRNV
jgi:hypothetical protein